ncbi:MAG: RsmB/NOP family class I SAM-dependent RNA methyltransferase [Clostridium sp.]|nr:RsmB/NOP family class I SAM-dependent RNA methyltransferase [Lachnoclostridium sp.]MCM1252388.1 RsmB/NOP family class I SAM-dependent RNA methyltransferase [Clostridium sp.]
MERTEEKIPLPRDFTERMRVLLKEEYPDFLKAYDGKRLYGLRFNPLKADKETFLARMPLVLEEVAWTPEGFYYKEEAQPGKHVFHEAGAYYIQEPSAMAVVETLSPKPGEKILDLCAAPGGKSTQIAGKMCGEGLLVANEIIPGRAKILSQNIERMGIANAVVCNETPERLAERFPSFFDRILVDAPCSGEGMFRKDETAVCEWSPENVAMCANRQRTILKQAALMLKPGGTLVYSTCTFSPEENEGVISRFLEEHPEFSIEESTLEKFFSPGRSEWVENPADGLAHTMRLWPHKIAGEGHFIAKLKKADGLYDALAAAVSVMEKETRTRRKGKGQDGIDDREQYRRFLSDELELSADIWEKWENRGKFIMFGDNFYLLPTQMIPLKGLTVLRPGLHLGVYKKNRIEPAHALALYLSPEQTSRCYDMTQEQAKAYLRGETFACSDTIKGWTLLTYGGYTVGFGKAGNGQMKNHYPKGLRK